MSFALTTGSGLFCAGCTLFVISSVMTVYEEVNAINIINLAGNIVFLAGSGLFLYEEVK